MHIKFEWDEEKRRLNREKHGLDFADGARFDWAQAVHEIDDRRDYGELRMVSLVTLDGRLHVCAWTPRGDAMRIIPMRKANDREKAAYRTLPAPHG